MAQSFKILLNKLQIFIRQYYYSQLIKGLIIFIINVCLLFVLFSLIEYFGYLHKNVRAVIFFAFIAINCLVLLKFLILPILGLFKIGKTFNIYDAARYLGKFFKNDIDDKIINALQLQSNINENIRQNNDVISAAIEQKSKNLILYKFSPAVNVKKNFKYIPLVLIIVITIIGGIYYIPELFKEPAKRIVNYEKEFYRPAPFDIIIKNDELRLFRGEDLKLDIKALGRRLPNEVFIESGKRKLRMDRVNNNEFSYLFRNTRENIEFYINANNYIFGPYNIFVESKPVIRSFSIAVDYPEYTRIENETILNPGDIRIPEGSTVEFTFNCDDVNDVLFITEQDTVNTQRRREGIYRTTSVVSNSFEYKIHTIGEKQLQGDSLRNYIEMIPDRYPVISVEQQQDEVLSSHIFFRGTINDDYGFSDLKFLYRIYNARYDSYDNENFNKRSIEFDENILNQIFYYHLDINEADVRPGEIVEYYFYVKDNDAINGPKTAETNIFSYQLPSHEEILAESMSGDEDVKQELETNIDNVRNASDEIESLKKSMLETDNVTWEQKDQLKNLLDKKDDIENALEEIKEFTEKSEMKRKQFSEEDEKIQEKHEELQKLFEEVLSDEMKELYKKIQEELDNLQKEELFQRLDEVQFEMKDLERRLDRMLELYKQLQLEKILTESINAVERSLEIQNSAIEENTAQNSDEDKAFKLQEEANEMFDLADDLINSFEEKNQELNKPNNIENTDNERDNIKNSQENALNQLDEKKQKRAMPHQDKAQQDLEKLKEMLEEMKQNLFYDTMFEDAQALRMLMENLLKSSFNQEELLKEVRTINVADPKYIDYIQEQRKISADLIFIEDSLVALSKRQAMIKDFITREIAAINMNIENAIEDLVERRRHSAATRQQFSMMHINNLVLLLNESLENMNEQLSEMSGEGMDGDMGGEGDLPSMQNMREMQEQMNQMLEQLQQGMQPMPGETGEGQMSMSEKLARMAAEQQAIRERMKELAEDYRSTGENAKELDQIIKDMERTEMDIIRKNINRQTISRQERILSRMLEHERAEIEREKEEKRMGTTAKSYEISNPEEIFEYNRERNRELELLRNLPPEFRNYYRDLIEKYFLNIDTE